MLSSSSKSLLLLSAALMLIACGPRPVQQEGRIPRCQPEEKGMDGRHLALIDSVVNAAIGQGEIPGAVVGIVRDGALVYEKAFGYKSLVPQMDSLTVETLFDLASLSKCVSTTIAILQLVERGQVRLMDPVSRYIPDFQPWKDPETGKKVEITVQHLLTHSSGLDAYLDSVPEYLEEFGPGTPQELMHYIATRTKRHFRPGSQQLYSCLNFITLQHILEGVTGQRLCDYAQTHIFDVLGLTHTTYFPLDAPEPSPLAALCAPTEVQEDGLPLKAQVHDPIARLINLGNSGNAGVFSNVEDLAILTTALLEGGAYNGRRILSPFTVQKMFTVPQTNDPCVARALGWDTYYTAPYTSGDLFPLENLRGHTGYTGTSLLLDPESGTALILLTHRVHPADKGSVARLRALVASITAASIGREPENNSYICKHSNHNNQ